MDIDEKVNEIMRLILDIDINTMHDEEEYTDSLEQYLNRLEIENLKSKIRSVLMK